MDKCANCGRPIGQLESPGLFNDSIVCGECYQRLRPSPLPQPFYNQQPEESEPLPADLLTEAAQASLHQKLRINKRKAPKAKRDPLFWPRMVFLFLYLIIIAINVLSASRGGPIDYVTPTIFFCCWLLLGLVKLVMNAYPRR